MLYIYNRFFSDTLSESTQNKKSIQSSMSYILCIISVEYVNLFLFSHIVSLATLWYERLRVLRFLPNEVPHSLTHLVFHTRYGTIIRWNIALDLIFPDSLVFLINFKAFLLLHWVGIPSYPSLPYLQLAHACYCYLYSPVEVNLSSLVPWFTRF